MTTNCNAAAQRRTIDTADKRGQHWTQAELDFVRDNTSHMTDEALALRLNRTLYAIWSVQATPLTERAARFMAPRRPETQWDRGFTTLADMGW